MQGLRLGLGLSQPLAGTGAASASIRTVPVSSNEAYMVAPHATLGAIALHLTYANGGDTTTPAASVGAPFGGWRMRGFRILPSVTSNPATEATEIVFDGGLAAGSIETAVNFGGVFAGHYHGFGTGAAYSQTAPDLTVAGMIAPTAIASSGEMRWSGATGTWSGSILLNADGSISTVTNVNLAADPFQAYLDMMIVGAGYTQMSLTGAAPWTDVSGYTLGALTDIAGTPASVTMRNPTTGTTATITDDLFTPGISGRKKSLMRRATDYKLYPDCNPLPAGTNLGNVTVVRTIVFGATTPDPAPVYAWDGDVNGNSGYNVVINNGVTWDATNKQIVLTQPSTAGVNNRVTFAMTGLVVGQSYAVSTIMTPSGPSASGGVQVAVSQASNGSSGVATTPQNALSNGTYTFTATATSMWLSLQQNGVSGGSSVLRVNRIGPVT